MKQLRIAVLMHENDDEERVKDYLIFVLANIWRDQGHEVLFLFGTKKFISADILFVHVDLSVVPDSYLEFADQYPVSVNRHVSDIRKRSYSEHLLGQHDSWDGKVLVKSNNNSAGIPERRSRKFTGRVQKKVISSIKKLNLKSFPSPMLSAHDYKVYDHLNEVPALYFYHPGMIVQKFLPEKKDDLYYTRILNFLGDKWKCTLLSSNEPIVKSDTAQIAQADVEPHPDILALRNTLNFDYGKFDYVIHKGKAILLDANKTIGSPRAIIENRNMKKPLGFYAEGLYSFF